MKKNSVYHSGYVCWGNKQEKILRDDTKHYPNKNESAMLRRIMSETGLSEEEVRDVKKYRVMLSEAAKSSPKDKHVSSQERFYRALIKDACKDTGLVPQHPDTLVTLQCLIDQRFDRVRIWWRPLWMYGNNPLNAETVVKRYAK